MTQEQLTRVIVSTITLWIVLSLWRKPVFRCSIFTGMLTPLCLLKRTPPSWLGVTGSSEVR